MEGWTLSNEINPFCQLLKLLLNVDIDVDVVSD